MYTKSLLVVDDDPNLRYSLSIILQRAGYLVTSVGQACEVIDRLQAGNYDLVIMDIKMPDIDGLALLPKILTVYPQLPVLILTAYPTPETAQEAKQSGARGFLEKPIDPDSLLETVHTLLEPRPDSPN